MFKRVSAQWVAGLAIVLALAALAGTAAAQTSTPAPAPAAGNQTRTITVIGSGEVQAQPDVAHISIGVEATAPTVSEALKNANTQMAAVLKALKDAGIADKDLQTSNFSISFDAQQPGVVVQPALPQASGTITPSETATTRRAGVYRVDNTVAVTVRDLTRVGPVIDAATAAGANNVYGVSFDLENTAPAETQARSAAVEDARSRAQSLAKLEGVTLGQVISASEVVGASSPVPFAAKAFGSAAVSTPIQSGQVTFSTQIQVVYAIQ